MKKLRLKKWVKNTLAIIGLYSILVIGIVALNARFEYLNNQKSTDSVGYVESVQSNR